MVAAVSDGTADRAAVSRLVRAIRVVHVVAAVAVGVGSGGGRCAGRTRRSSRCHTGGSARGGVYAVLAMVAAIADRAAHRTARPGRGAIGVDDVVAAVAIRMRGRGGGGGVGSVSCSSGASSRGGGGRRTAFFHLGTCGRRTRGRL